MNAALCWIIGHRWDRGRAIPMGFRLAAWLTCERCGRTRDLVVDYREERHTT